MARIFDVIEYPDEMRDEIVHRFPETGFGDFRIGSQVIVREAQSAVFFRDGRALDTFKAGRHTITTANVPYLIDLIGKAFNDRTPFTAEVYFVSMREFADQKWGTAQPIIIRNPGMGLGVALLQGFGSYSFQVANPQQFLFATESSNLHLERDILAYQRELASYMAALPTNHKAWVYLKGASGQLNEVVKLISQGVGSMIGF